MHIKALERLSRKNLVMENLVANHLPRIVLEEDEGRQQVTNKEEFPEEHLLVVQHSSSWFVDIAKF